ncbi:uncharacterized protein METZ01_LOCUS186196, partial [marine metagenome]
ASLALRMERTTTRYNYGIVPLRDHHPRRLATAKVVTLAYSSVFVPSMAMNRSVPNISGY